MMKKLYSVWLSALLLGFSFASQAADASSSAAIDQTHPYAMMKQVATRTFDRLKKEQPEIHKDPQQLKVIVEQEMMPYVNSTYAALKLLGPNLRGAKRSDVETFIKAFHDYLITSYAQALTQYTTQTFEFSPAQPVAADRRITTVKVNIIDAPRPNIEIAFKLIKNKNTGKWSAFDMVAEGISLLSSKQAEWTSIIRQKGILAVAKELQQKAAQPIHFESAKS